jgi:hypothetical protein
MKEGRIAFRRLPEDGRERFGEIAGLELESGHLLSGWGISNSLLRPATL